MDQSTNSSLEQTPGPWTVAGFRTPTGRLRLGIWPTNTQLGRIAVVEGNEANARLIAAAPELLAVLKGVLSQAGSSIDTEWLERASLAIAQAEGRQP